MLSIFKPIFPYVDVINTIMNSIKKLQINSFNNNNSNSNSDDNDGITENRLKEALLLLLTSFTLLSSLLLSSNQLTSNNNNDDGNNNDDNDDNDDNDNDHDNDSNKTKKKPSGFIKNWLKSISRCFEMFHGIINKINSNIDDTKVDTNTNTNTNVTNTDNKVWREFLSSCLNHQQYSPSVRIFLSIRNCFTFDDLHRLCMQLLTDEKYPELSMLLIGELDAKSINTNDINNNTNNEYSNLLTAVINNCINASQTSAFKTAIEIAQIYKRPEELELKSKFKWFRLSSLLDKGKWQISVEMANSNSQRIAVYQYLKGKGIIIIISIIIIIINIIIVMIKGMHKEALTVYTNYHLYRYNVSPTTDDELLEQHMMILQTYLQLSLPLNCILFIDSMQTLEIAAHIMGYVIIKQNYKYNNKHNYNKHNAVKLQRNANASLPPCVGVDAEWKTTPNGTSSHGASILQIAIPNHILIFDLIGIIIIVIIY